MSTPQKSSKTVVVSPQKSFKMASWHPWRRPIHVAPRGGAATRPRNIHVAPRGGAATRPRNVHISPTQVQSVAKAVLGQLQANALPNDAASLAAAVADGSASDQMRQAAAERLGALGAAASAHIDVLGALLANGDVGDGARIVAAEAIGKIGDGEAYRAERKRIFRSADVSLGHRSDHRRSAWQPRRRRDVYPRKIHVARRGVAATRSPDLHRLAPLARLVRCRYLEDILEQGDHVDEGIWIACQNAHGGW